MLATIIRLEVGVVSVVAMKKNETLQLVAVVESPVIPSDLSATHAASTPTALKLARALTASAINALPTVLVPSLVVAISSLPRTPTGKVRSKRHKK